MASTPAEELAEAFVELARGMSGEFDLDGFLRLLVNRCVQLFDVPAAGTLIADHGVAVSAESLLPALRRAVSPLVDSARDGVPVVVPDLGAADEWPDFVTDVRGFASLYVVPLCCGADVLGSLALFRDTPGEPAEGRVVRAVADFAALRIVQGRAMRRSAELAAQLQHALDSRVIIEQAKGVLAERLGVGVGAAFAALRGYARSHNTRVSELARSVVDGRFDTGLL